MPPFSFATTQAVLTLTVHTEFDVIASRQRARQIAALCGFSPLDQARIATVVSELARNIFNYAVKGTVRFSVAGDNAQQQLLMAVEDRGPGIGNLDDILGGHYRSTTGMGLGILAARRLMDRFDIRTGKDIGTAIFLCKALPAGTPPMTAATIDRLLSQLDVLPSNVALSEATQQNRELTDALNALQARQDELLVVSARLEETNRRVEALNVQLDQKADALLRADRSKDEFLAILSHELRGPLSAAGMAAQLLQADPVGAEKTAKMSQVISRQVGHMSRLVEDLLDVSRVSRGLVLIEKAPLDIGEVISGAVEQVATAAASKGHAIEVTLPPCPAIIQGDRTRMLQVVSNLLTNAIRYTPDGGKIHICLALADGALSIKIVDNGIGLHADLMPNLFDLYVQAERTSDRQGGGLGLGLALVKNLVEAHDGTVTAESEGKNRGSTFTVRLPVIDAA
ncbi:MAG: ATP-binding protein [Pseudomonadota bacterium]